MTIERPLIFLDRDGVLNRMVINLDHGTIDSPLHPDQVEIFPWVPQALARLCSVGYGLSIVSNQPAAAKLKTTHDNLLKVHEKVLQAVTSEGATILSSHLCFHKAEDGCHCRKPATGLLEDACSQNPTFTKSGAWIVGDGVTDIQAGHKFGIKTAFLGPQKCDACKIFINSGMSPDFWGENLKHFVDFLTDNS